MCVCVCVHGMSCVCLCVLQGWDLRVKVIDITTENFVCVCLCVCGIYSVIREGLMLCKGKYKFKGLRETCYNLTRERGQWLEQSRYTWGQPIHQGSNNKREIY